MFNQKLNLLPVDGVYMVAMPVICGHSITPVKIRQA